MRYSILILLLFFTMGIEAQTHSQLTIDKEPLSPSEQRYRGLITDDYTLIVRNILLNPAAYSFVSIDSLTKSYISTKYASGKLDGDFLIYEGNSFTDYQLSGFGKQTILKYGTLYGKVHYAQGEHKNYGWNAIRWPDLYLPYIATDSIGGDFSFKDYYVLGGFSCELNKWNFGAEFSFRGEQAYRSTDPRCLNTTSWVGFKLGAARLINDHLLMLSAVTERNKQHATMKFWRAGEQQRFFVANGFGEYDNDNSGVWFGYSRMFYLNSIGGTITYRSPYKNRLSVFANFDYNYAKMKTEESGYFQNLFMYKQHVLKPEINIKLKVNKTWHNSLVLSSNIITRKGIENIYERYMVDSITRVVDYRKIDEQQPYNLSTITNTFFVKSSLFFGNNTFSLFAGAQYFSRNETYRDNRLVIFNSSVKPYGGFEYSLLSEKNEFTLNASFAVNNIHDSEYDVVPFTEKKYGHIDFQHAFTQYAYYNSTYNQIRINTTFVHYFKKFGVGTNVQLLYTQGNRDSGTSYNEPVDFVSPAPVISTEPDKHDEVWGSASLFLVF